MRPHDADQAVLDLIRHQKAHVHKLLERGQNLPFEAFLLTLLIVCGFGSLFVAQTVTFENIKNILEVIFGPVIALVSAATGFYFGAQQPNKK